MAEMIEQLIRKMGLHDEPKLLGKSKELVRLLELRSTNVNATLSAYAKIVLCIDLAAVFLGVYFDQENALKLSGLKKTQYANHKRLFEKLLDLNKQVGVSDVCVKLGLNEVSKKATELLQLYSNIVEKEATDFDITHPQYPAMAVFQACKLGKTKIPKAKILAFSHLRPSQWKLLEERWDRIIASHYTVTKDNVKSPETTCDEKKSDGQMPNLNRSKVPEIEDYEVWKRRMLAIAELDLAMEKENAV